MGGVQSVFLEDTPKYEARAIFFAPSFCKHLPGDKVGGISCLLALTPFFVLVSLGTLFWTRRELGSLLLAVGLVASTLFNDYLKLVFRDPRPCSNDLYCSLSEGDVYGMPSGHSQFVSFGAAYTCMWALSGRWRATLLERVFFSLATVLGAALVCVSRLYLHVHTTRQVLVGASLGVSLGVLWFFLVEVIRPAFAWVEATSLARFFRLRDCSACDTLTLEYEAVRSFNVRERSTTAEAAKGVQPSSSGAAANPAMPKGAEQKKDD
jgi:dolichyldiphosphatase